MKSTKERYINHYINHQILDDWKNDLALMGEDYVPTSLLVRRRSITRIISPSVALASSATIEKRG